ncbi:cytochrome b N-terminal domain-containing protein, partial [Streptomyces sp. NPDC048845]|uniref:cytochrome b N-terminal domain-containing protein n=1 Tax=Streptomyces sp. NPDC048845 TaxID=3155390 RepID=UPI00341D5989
MPRPIATAERVSREELLDFIRPRHHAVLMTRKRDGSPQMSPLDDIDPRLYVTHILLVPGLLLALVVVHLILVVYLKH